MQAVGDGDLLVAFDGTWAEDTFEHEQDDWAGRLAWVAGGVWKRQSGVWRTGTRNTRIPSSTWLGGLEGQCTPGASQWPYKARSFRPLPYYSILCRGRL
jgi:hypothetical protein